MMKKCMAFVIWLLLSAPVYAQPVSADRLVLRTGPCQLTSVNATVDKFVLSVCPVVTTVGSSNMTLTPGGDLVLDPVGNDVIPTFNYDINLGTPQLKFLSLSVGELIAETLVAQDVLATIGGRVIIAPTTLLTLDLSAIATSITVKHNNLANGARVYLQSAPLGVPQVEWLAVTSSASGAGPYTYTVTRNLDGTGANVWYAGDAVLNTRTTGAGMIDLYSTSGILSGSGPSIVGNVRTGTTFNQIETRWAIGNLNGLYGYATDTFGVGFGSPSAANIVIDPTYGYRARVGTTSVVLIDPSGNITIGNSGGNKLTYVVSTGALVLTGSITAGSGTIGGWDILSDRLQDSDGDVGIFSGGSGGGNIRFWAGHATPSSAPFRVYENGAIVATSATISGDGSGLTAISGGNITTNTIAADKMNVSTLASISADLGAITGGSLAIGSTDKMWFNDSGDGELRIGGSTKASSPFWISYSGNNMAVGSNFVSPQIYLPGTPGTYGPSSASFLRAAGLGGTGNASACVDAGGYFYRGSPGC